jgi:hypothetical protein
MITFSVAFVLLLLEASLIGWIRRDRGARLTPRSAT